MGAAETPDVNNILLATMAGAMIVLSGALFATVFAIGKLAASRTLVRLSYLFYAVLVVSVLVLARTLAFSGFWHAVSGAMLAGYLVAPHAIWVLCTGTHGKESSPGDRQRTQMPDQRSST